MSTYQQTQAFGQAGLAVVEAVSVTGESLDDAATRFVRSADPHEITGRRGEHFTWSFDYDDVPRIVDEARKILA